MIIKALDSSFKFQHFDMSGGCNRKFADLEGNACIVLSMIFVRHLVPLRSTEC